MMSLRLKQVKENTKPIILLISWLSGRPAQVNKYTTLYTDQDFDVLVAQISMWQAICDIKSTEQFALDIMEVLKNAEEDYSEIFIHSFSAGALVWGLCMKLMKRV